MLSVDIGDYPKQKDSPIRLPENIYIDGRVQFCTWVRCSYNKLCTGTPDIIILTALMVMIMLGLSVLLYIYRTLRVMLRNTYLQRSTLEYQGLYMLRF